MSINDIKQAISRGKFTTTELQGIINYSRTVGFGDYSYAIQVHDDVSMNAMFSVGGH